MGEKVEHEDWVYENRPREATEIIEEMGKIKEKENELECRLNNLDDMLSLLDGTGDELVKAVIKLLSKTEEGLKVVETRKGDPIDLFVYDNKGRSLAIEVTGIIGYLKKSDPHWADFLGYLPEHNEKNEEGRIERIVLVVNTQCNKKVKERERNGDITQPVKQTVLDNHICVVRSVDLYNMWLEVLKGKKVTEIFDTLFENEGILK